MVGDGLELYIFKPKMQHRACFCKIIVKYEQRDSTVECRVKRDYTRLSCTPAILASFCSKSKLQASVLCFYIKSCLINDFKIDKKCTIFWTGGTMSQNPNATWCNDLHVVDGVRLLHILYLDHPVEEWWCRRKWEHYWRDFYQRLILLRFNLNTIRMSAAWGGSTCCKCH